jgi:hypothetical protein
MTATPTTATRAAATPAGSAWAGRQPRYRLAAAALAAAGAGFAIYPAVRPFSDETSLRGAAAFASARWLVAHSTAMIAFVLLALGLFGVAAALRETAAARRARLGAVLAAAGAGLTLPYYGAETFGLHAAGQEALRRGDAQLLTSLTGAIRWQEGIWFITAGLLLVAAGAVIIAWAIWGSRSRARYAGIPLAAGFALYLPQFTAGQPVRVAHGLLITAGGLLLAWNLARRTGRRHA